jgi:hypothetical protein
MGIHSIFAELPIYIAIKIEQIEKEKSKIMFLIPLEKIKLENWRKMDANIEFNDDKKTLTSWRFK